MISAAPHREATDVGLFHRPLSRRGNGVQRDAAIQVRIVGEIYLFHSSGTQFSKDASLASTEARFDLLHAGRARR